MVGSDIFIAAVGLVFAMHGYYVRELSGAVKDLQRAIVDFKTHVAEDYLSKEDFRRICENCGKKR